MPSCRWACACCRRSAPIVREEQDRSGAIELLMPTIQSADLWRESGRYDAYGKEMLRIKDRHERDMLYGPTNEEMITEIFRSLCALLQGSAAQPLSHPVEVPRRGAAALRPDARARIPDEGRLFVRSRFRRRQARLQPHVRRLSAHLRAHGAERRSRWSPKAARSAATSPTNSSFWPTPARARCSATAIISTSRCPGADVDFDDVAGCRRIVDKWTSLYAATSEKHDAAAFAEPRPDKRLSARGIEVGHIFYFGTKYSEPMKAVVTGPDGTERPVHMGSYGIGPSRLVAAIIEASHDDAGIKWPEAVAPFKALILNLKQGGARHRRRLRAALCRAHRQGHRRALSRPRRAAGREIRHRRPDRHSLADPGRAARARRGQGRGQAPRRRGARTDVARGRASSRL